MPGPPGTAGPKMSDPLMGDENPARALRVLALEAWMGGSHARFLEGWREHSRHRLQVEGLAPRHWKWRMAAGAWELGRRITGTAQPRPDVLFATDFVDLAQLPAFLPPDWAAIPRVLYMHENQLTYPLRSDQADAGGAGRDVPRDVTWGFKNVLSCLAADLVLFNSAFHRDTFARAADSLLRTLPRPTPRADLEQILARAQVIGPGITWTSIPLGTGAPAGRPLRLAFNHRWEHDKDPASFLRAVLAARTAGASLELVLLGQDFERLDAPTRALLARLEDCVIEHGFVEDRRTYLAHLGTCDAVVSTARHEFYGIAVLEAVAAGCAPLVPARLAYPEVLPDVDGAFYGEGELAARLMTLAKDPAPLRAPTHRNALRSAVRDHGIDHLTRRLDRTLSELHDAAERARRQ